MVIKWKLFAPMWKLMTALNQKCESIDREAWRYKKIHDNHLLECVVLVDEWSILVFGASYIKKRYITILPMKIVGNSGTYLNID